MVVWFPEMLLFTMSSALFLFLCTFSPHNILCGRRSESLCNKMPSLLPHQTGFYWCSVGRGQACLLCTMQLS